MKLGITFHDDTPAILRFDKDDIRSIVLGGVVAHVRMLATYVGTAPEDDESLMRTFGEALDEMPIWKAYSVIYDYANDGVFPPDRSVLEDYLRLAISFRIELVYANELHGIDIGSPKPNTSPLYLPPYAPELNPDEYLNRDLKTSIRSGPIAKTATALLEKARACMMSIAAMPDRVRSYFSHEYVRYAQ